MKTSKDYYALRKADVREQAIEWQSTCSEECYSYGELAYYQDYFEKLVIRFGLLR